MLLPVIVGGTGNSCGTRPWSASGGVESFHTTRWTIVMRAAQNQAPWGQSAFSRVVPSLLVSALHFLSAPWAFAGGCARFDPKFFSPHGEHRAFKGVDRLKGKFRSFLLASFQNHLSDAADRARRLKRGGDKNFVHLDAEDAEKRYRLEPVDFLTAEKIFDARWAMTVLGEALKKLSQEYAVGREASTFEALKVFLDTNNSINRPRTTRWRVDFRLRPARSKHISIGCESATPRCCARSVGRTVSDPAEIDEEIYALCEALIATEGRLCP
jgi:hypothetical protein